MTQTSYIILSFSGVKSSWTCTRSLIIKPSPRCVCNSHLPYLRAHPWNEKESETRGPVERRHEPHECAEVSEFVGQESGGGRAEYVGEGDGRVDEGRVLDAEAQRSARQHVHSEAEPVALENRKLRLTLQARALLDYLHSYWMVCIMFGIRLHQLSARERSRCAILAI